MQDGRTILGTLARLYENLIKSIYRGAPEYAIQSSYNRLQAAIEKMLLGRKGVIDEHILAARVPNSGRLVITVGTNIPFGYIGIPRIVAQDVNIAEGDIVVFGRQPTLWHKSVMSAHVIYVDGLAMKLHVSYCKPLGADFDGDTCWFWAPKTEEGRKDALIKCHVSRYCSIEQLGKELDPRQDDPKKYDIDSWVVTRYREVEGFCPSLDDISQHMLLSREDGDFKGLCDEVMSNQHLVKIGVGMAGQQFYNATAICPDVLTEILPFCERLSQGCLSAKHGHKPPLEDILEVLRNGFESSDARIATLLRLGMPAQASKILVERTAGQKQGLDSSVLNRPLFMATQPRCRLSHLHIPSGMYDDVISRLVKEVLDDFSTGPRKDIFM